MNHIYTGKTDNSECPQRWQQQAGDKLIPNPGDSAIYRDALKSQLNSLNQVPTKPSVALIEFETALSATGVWDAIIRWEEIRDQYRECLVDWCVTVVSLVEEALETVVERSINEAFETSGVDSVRPRFNPNNPFAGLAFGRRDGKSALLITIVPDALAAFLMCNLLARTASDITWFKELTQLKNLRAQALASQRIDEQAAIDSQMWGSIADALWAPGEQSLRPKTEELATMFKVIAVATSDLRQQLNAL